MKKMSRKNRVSFKVLKHISLLLLDFSLDFGFMLTSTDSKDSECLRVYAEKPKTVEQIDLER